MDWLASALTLVTIFLFQRKNLFYGNIFGVSNVICWLILIFQQRTWGLLPLEGTALVMYILGLWRLYRDRNAA